MLQRDARYRRVTLAFAVSLASVLLLVQHDDWFARFVLFFPALLVVAVAALAAGMPVVLLVAVPALLLQFASTMVPEELPASKVAILARQPWRERTTAGIYDASIDGVDAIGYYADNYNDSYLLYRPDFSRRLAFARAMTADGLADEFRQAGVEAVYAAPGTIGRQRVFDETVRRGVLRHIKGKFWTVVR